MERGNLILLVDLIVDFLVIVGALYLFSIGYFSNLGKDDLNTMFLKIGLVGLALMSVTLYLLLKKK
jgi:hypothetical protein